MTSSDINSSDSWQTKLPQRQNKEPRRVEARGQLVVGYFRSNQRGSNQRGRISQNQGRKAITSGATRCREWRWKLGGIKQKIPRWAPVPSKQRAGLSEVLCGERRGIMRFPNPETEQTHHYFERRDHQAWAPIGSRILTSVARPNRKKNGGDPSLHPGEQGTEKGKEVETDERSKQKERQKEQQEERTTECKHERTNAWMHE